jgi:hypothetical protein
MGKSVYKKLIITALVTSIAFGGFAALNFYIFRELNPMSVNEKFVLLRSGKPDSAKGQESRQELPHKIRLPQPNPINNSLYTVAGMLLVWLLNIGILLLIEKITVNNKYRAWMRYVSSYTVIILAITTYTSINPIAPSFQKFKQGPGRVIEQDKNPRVSVDTMPDLPMPGHLTADILDRRINSISRGPGGVLGIGFEARQIPFMTAIIFNTIVIAMLELILLQHHKGQVDLENEQLKMSHLLARHQHLKHQLHPHFLFNSLNTLKSLIKKSPGEAEKYLMRLSGFLRSSLTMNDLDVISLKDELQLCTDYMDMQKIRFGSAFNYYLNIPTDIIESVSVPAFSIQLLIENAIKHNILTKENPLTLHIDYLQDGFIQVKNNKKLKNIQEVSSSIGLKNLSERYKMISGSDVKVIDGGTEFIVQIQALKR